MKRRILIILAIAGTAALFQWWQQHQLASREEDLREEFTRLNAARPKAPGTTGNGAPDAAAKAREVVPAVFDPAKFVQDLAALAPLVDSGGGPADDATRERIRKKALPLLSQIATAPPDLLKQALEGLMASSLPGQFKAEASQTCLIRIAENDPAWSAGRAAITSGGSMPLQAILQRWASKDAAAALAWIAQAEKNGTLAGPPLSDPSLAGTLRQRVADGQAESDPAGVIERLATLSPAEQSEGITTAARTVKTREARTQLLERIAADPALPLADFANTLSQHSGFQASREALDAAQLSPAAHDTAAAAIASSDIGPQTPERAAWLMENLRGPDPKSFGEFVRVWTQSDFNAAATWLRDLPASARRDFAIGVFAPMVGQKEPPSAIDWATTIASPETRAAALKQIWQDWHARSPDEAAAYFLQKGLATPE